MFEIDFSSDFLHLFTFHSLHVFVVIFSIVFVTVGCTVFWKYPRIMSKRKSEKPTEKLANGNAENDAENSEDNDAEDQDSRASKRVKASKEKASKQKKESARSPRKHSPVKSLAEDEESDTEYEVLKIVDVRTDKKGKKQFLVNWKGYSSKDNSWEPEENLSCNDLIEDYYKEAKNKSPEKTKKSEKTPGKSPRGKKKN